jgi:hypothetical protein
MCVLMGCGAAPAVRVGSADTVASAATPSESPSTTAVPATWTEIDVGPIEGDQAASLAEFDGHVWMARTSEKRSQITVTQIDGEPGAATVIDLGHPAFDFQMRGTPNGLLVVASNSDDFTAQSWTSDDGATWLAGELSDSPFDPIGIAWVDDHLLVSGAFRPPQTPNAGPFRPGLFRSNDGVDWTEVLLDPTVFATSDGFLGPIVDTGDRLVTTSSLPTGDYSFPATFESVDRGATWRRAADTGPSPAVVSTAGSTIIGINAIDSPEAGSVPIVVNQSGAWQPADLSLVVPPYQYADSFALSSEPVALLALSVEPSPEYCYDHRVECNTGSTARTIIIGAQGSVAAIDEGDLTGRGLVDAGMIGSDGSIYLLRHRDDRFVLRSWPATGEPVPTLPPVEPFTPSGPPLVTWQDQVTVGKVYRYQLRTHCGIGFLGQFNDSTWWILGSPTGVYGGSDDSGSHVLYGEIHVIAQDRIEYWIDDQFVATYESRTDEPQLCA